MPNLPQAGSQFWGAALNKYLRSVEQELDALRANMNTMTAAVAYSGSGWTEGYTLTTTNATERGTDIYDVNANSIFTITGDLVITLNASSPRVTQIKKFELYWGSQDESGRPIKLYKQVYNTNSASVDLQMQGMGIQTLDNAPDGYYPVYLHIPHSSTSAESEIYPIISYQEFIINERYIMIGILRKIGANYRFLKKWDSAFKSLAQNRYDNFNPTAFLKITDTDPNNSTANKTTIGNLFRESLGTDNKHTLTVCFNTSIIGYQGNGISAPYNTQSNNDFNLHYIPSDIRYYSGNARDRITLAYDANTSYTTLTATACDNDINFTNAPNEDSGSIYGIYVTAFGDFVIQAVPIIYDITEDGKQVINQNELLRMSWSLNQDSQFLTGGLVFLGAYYYDYSVGHWCSVNAALNGVAPAAITGTQLEDGKFIYWPEQRFATAISDNKYATYQFKPTPLTGTDASLDYKLQLNSNYKLAESDSYNIPVLPDSLYQLTVDADDNTAAHVQLGVVKMAAYSAAAPWTITDTRLSGGSGTDISVPTIGNLEAFNTTDTFTWTASGTVNIDDLTTLTMPNTSLTTTNGLKVSTTGDFALEATNSLSIDTAGALTVGGTTKPSSITQSTNGTFATQANATTITSTGNTTINSTGSSADVTITANNKCIIKGANGIEFKTNGKSIKINNTLEFTNNAYTTTSDRRCKENVTSLTGATCLQAVRNIDAKTFNYIGSDQTTLGVIAQDIEQYCPQYKDELVYIVEDAQIPDKRAVAEGKLLFILWQAVRELLITQEG